MTSGLTTRGAVALLGLGAALGAGVAAAKAPETIVVGVDEEVSIRLARRASARRVGPDTVRIRTADGGVARGETRLGRFVLDKATQRRVVVRPEGVREYYQLVVGLDREDAAKKAERLLRRVERSGRFGRLEKVDRALVAFFGHSWGAGVRLDDEDVFATYPPRLAAGDPLLPYRLRVAGDDDIWDEYVDGGIFVFDQLRENPEFERFHHPVESETGVPAAQSVLRTREHRRVLVRRDARTVLFLPDLPTRDDLSDAGFAAGAEYRLSVRRSLPDPRLVITGLGERARTRRGATLQVRSDPGTETVGVDGRVGDVRVPTRPRIVNVTPPNGETRVDPNTDWEDPDNAFEVPLFARRTFTIRLRFDQPLDPRSVGAATFQLRRVAIAPGTPQEVLLNEPVEVGVFLVQTRLGEVRVDVTPRRRPDPDSRYQVVVRGALKSLGGARLELDYQSTFETY